MTRSSLRPTVTLALAGTLAVPLLVLPAALRAQTQEAGSFLIRRGADTVVIENFTRSVPAGTLTSDLSTPQTGRIHLVATVTPDALVSRIVADAYAPGASTPVSHADIAIARDTATATLANGTVQHIAIATGALPFVNGSVALIDQIVQRARAIGQFPATVPLFALAGGQSLAASVSKLPADSVAVSIAGVEMRVALDAGGHAAGGVVPVQNITIQLVRGTHSLSFAPPDYAPPAGAPYVGETVTVPTPAGFTLGGTLTLPRNRTGRVPAVVTITGSGLEDRDEAIPGVTGYRPFYQLADTLGRRGIAVLRLDDRSYGASHGNAANATSRDFANDTRAAIAYLRTRPEIDANRLFLVGHSEGGLIAPMIAASDPTLRGIVLMAGTASPGRDIIAAQVRYAIDNNPSIPAAQRDQAYAAQMKTVDSVAARQPWTHEFLSYDPTPTARSVHVPVLILQGGNDRQVPVAQAALLDSAFRRGGDRDVTMRVFPGLDHLFLVDPTGNPATYGTLPSKHIGPDVLGTIADWIAKHSS